MLFSAILLFIYYCYQAVKHRIRKQIDRQVRISLLSVFMMLAPVLLIITITVLYNVIARNSTPEILAYGFLTFFGWITAIILGMTFKTMPFIVWNRVYHLRSGKGKTPTPKELFSQRLYNVMSVTYIAGFFIFLAGIFASIPWVLQTGAALLLLASILFNINVLKLYFHKPAVS
jgi:small-conductance mechanosensitive channel